jgi:mannose/fructose/N-acetylgalactosamine-specific phosphotransferase system component IIB
MKAVVSIDSLMEQLDNMHKQGYELVEVEVAPMEGDKGKKFVDNGLRLAPYNYTDFDAVDLDSLPEK